MDKEDAKLLKKIDRLRKKADRLIRAHDALAKGDACKAARLAGFPQIARAIGKRTLAERHNCAGS
jgi:hypothetical protein